MISAIFERFVETTPITVMVRAIMERIFAPELLDKLFEEEAEQQYQRKLLFSTVVGLMSLVVCGMYPSVSAAYKGFEKLVGVSKVSLYSKINGLEPKLSQSLVRYSSEQLSVIHQEFPAGYRSILPGYEVRIIDGNHIGATEHRLEVLRTEAAGALPGQALVVLDPQRGLAVDVFPCEDGHAQERSLFPLVLEQVKAKEVWIADRNFCTKDFLTQIAEKKAYFVIREHKQIAWTEVTGLESIGQNDSGELFEQQVELDSGLKVRRIVIQLKNATRHGDEQVWVLTNLPKGKVDGLTVADLYLKRWQIEKLFQTITDTFQCELKTLGYPRAALFVFCVALLAFNILSTVRASLKEVHGATEIDENLSDYYVVEDVQGTWRGLEIAILPEEWQPFQGMTNIAFAQYLRQLAERVNLQRFRKSKRGPKKAKAKKNFDPNHPHVATARLLKPK
ncbi:MAG: IS4 family transposase [Cyanobacteria bacterium CRU_2_1]|nr:IS4 family transposase [Cyanobacteria bacterium CRU_2_1]